MEKEEKLLKQNKSLLIIIIILLLVIIGILFYFMRPKNNKIETNNNNDIKKVEEKKVIESNSITKEPTPKENNNNNKETKKEEYKTPTKEELINYVKNKMIKDNLLDENNIDILTFDTISLEGYYKNSSKKVYAIIGTFRCKEGDSCLYQEQLDDPDKNGIYKWSVAIPTTYKDGEYTFGELTSTFIVGDDFIEVWEDIE